MDKKLKKAEVERERKRKKNKEVRILSKRGDQDKLEIVATYSNSRRHRYVVS